MVLLALLAMYWRDPAFLTVDSDQSLEIRKLQEISRYLPPDLLVEYLSSINPRVIQGQAGSTELFEASGDEAVDIDDRMRRLGDTNDDDQ